MDANGNILPAAPAPIQISFADVAAADTVQFVLGLNLDSRETQPATALFSPTDPTSYNFSTSGNIFDSLGNAHVFSTVLRQDRHRRTVADVRHGRRHCTGQRQPGCRRGQSGHGELRQHRPAHHRHAPERRRSRSPAAQSPRSPSPSICTGSTQYGSDFGVNTLSQNGFASGRLAGFNVSDDGILVGRYTNGQTRNLAQVVLADFRNLQGLKPLGDNLWEETADSGLAIVGTPNTGSLGVLQSSAVEDSNVDLTAELVNMITAQRVYQANAQTIKTQDSILQTLVNLR